MSRIFIDAINDSKEGKVVRVETSKGVCEILRSDLMILLELEQDQIKEELVLELTQKDITEEAKKKIRAMHAGIRARGKSE